MKGFENPFFLSRQIRTTDQLVEQLRHKPPGIFRDAIFSLVDNRSSTQPNLFTFATLSEAVNVLLMRSFYGNPQMSFSLDRGSSEQFGFIYKTRIQTVEEARELRARRIRYDPPQRRFLVRPNRVFQPEETLILRGVDQARIPLEIAMTQYRKGDEEVNVYKMTSGKDESAKSIIIVGSPNWDVGTQRGIATSFKIPQFFEKL